MHESHDGATLRLNQKTHLRLQGGITLTIVVESRGSARCFGFYVNYSFFIYPIFLILFLRYICLKCDL